MKNEMATFYFYKKGSLFFVSANNLTYNFGTVKTGICPVLFICA